jgi:hypothetical protein
MEEILLALIAHLAIALIDLTIQVLRQRLSTAQPLQVAPGQR